MKKLTAEWVRKAESDLRVARNLAKLRPPAHDETLNCQPTQVGWVARAPARKAHRYPGCGPFSLALGRPTLQILGCMLTPAVPPHPAENPQPQSRRSSSHSTRSILA